MGSRQRLSLRSGSIDEVLSVVADALTGGADRLEVHKTHVDAFSEMPLAGSPSLFDLLGRLEVQPVPCSSAAETWRWLWDTCDARGLYPARVFVGSPAAAAWLGLRKGRRTIYRVPVAAGAPLADGEFMIVLTPHPSCSLRDAVEVYFGRASQERTGEDS
jgi:hypothetical protein